MTIQSDVYPYACWQYRQKRFVISCVSLKIVACFKKSYFFAKPFTDSCITPYAMQNTSHYVLWS